MDGTTMAVTPDQGKDDRAGSGCSGRMEPGMKWHGLRLGNKKLNRIHL